MKDFTYPDTNLPWLWRETIFLTEHGSQAYGLALPTSDTDYKGVTIPTPRILHGFRERFEQAEFRGEPDMVVYGIQKFFKLAADCNPSIIEVLFTERENHVKCTDAGNILLSHRNEFLSKRAKHTFSGYAVSQLKKLLRSKERAPERVNPQRSELIQEFGYDTKDAMHTVRLLKMGMEILRGEGVQVRREDREELLSIRSGAWALDDIILWAESALKSLDSLYETSTALPHSPDFVRLDSLCQDLVEASL